MFEVIILKEGYARPETGGCMRASGTITLVKGSRLNIVVDTGSPWEKDAILKGLSSHNVSVDDVRYVVCTHGHVDHVGNLNLFPQATHIVSYDICKGDQYFLHNFKQGIPYEIDEDVEVWPTPGHTGSDVSVLVRNTNLGTVAITGDLFECEADLDSPSLWQESSENPHLQEQSRIEILRVADFIVPGHGPMFQVPKESKRQLRVIMFHEEYLSTSELKSSDKSVVILEVE